MNTKRVAHNKGITQARMAMVFMRTLRSLKRIHCNWPKMSVTCRVQAARAAKSVENRVINAPTRKAVRAWGPKDSVYMADKVSIMA